MDLALTENLIHIMIVPAAVRRGLFFMLISGLQKLTLLDYPGRMACTVFTGGCNFRCPFCHNASLVLPERLSAELTQEEVLLFLRKRTGILDGVAVTGGEPLLHRDIGDFLREIKELGFSVKLDTNGSFPNLLQKLIEEKLVDYVAMDIKNSPLLYAETVGVPGFDLSPVNESRKYLLSGPVDYEFRTTVVKGLHTKESLLDTAEWLCGAKKYYLQQFRDSGDLILPDGLRAFDEAEMKLLHDAVAAVLPVTELRGV